MMILERLKLAFAMIAMLGGFALLSACGDDDGDGGSTPTPDPDPGPDPVVVQDAPTLSVTTEDLTLDAGGSLDIEVSVSAPGGFASTTAVVLAGEGSVSVSQDLTAGDTDGTIILSYTTEAAGQANIQLTVTDGQEDARSSSAIIQVTAFAPLAESYSNLMAMLNSRPEFSEIAALITTGNRAEAFLVEGAEGAQYGTFFAPVNGFLSDLFAVSPFLNSIEDIDQQLASDIVNLFWSSRMRFRGIATPFGGEYRGLTAAQLQDGATLTNDAGEETGINRGGQNNNRNYGNASFAATGMGYFKDGEAVTFANFTANDIMINEVDGKAGIVAHVIDKAWFDFMELSDFPNGVESISASLLRSEVAPRALGWSTTAWWPLNGINGVVSYSGSRSNNGILFISLDAVDAINDLTPTTDLNDLAADGSNLVWGWPAGPQDPENDPTCSSCPSWYPRPEDGRYIPDADFLAGQDYWFRHSVQMTDATMLANGAVGGTFTNIAGDNVTIDLAGGTVTMGDVTANVVATIAWGDNSGRYVPLATDDADFIQAVSDQGVIYRVVHVIDTSLF